VTSNARLHSLCPKLLFTISLAASAPSSSGQELEIRTSAESAILTWPGDELLFVSPTLEDFQLVEAQSPFEVSIAETERLFFQLRSLPTIQTPLDGSTIGTELIDIQGLVGAFSSFEDLSITINGQSAQIETSAAESSFLLRDFALSPGVNTLTVVFSTPEGVQQTQALSVTFVPVTANNIVIAGDYAYAAQSTEGLAAINLKTRELTIATTGNNIVPRVDDLSFDGRFLFTLNAGSTANALSTFSLAEPAQPSLVSGPVSAMSGFFSGVSAANGRVAVAGGTSSLQVRNYNTETGAIANQSSSLDFVIGHPDVLLSADGELAHVSVDFPNNNFRFGISTVNLNDPPVASTVGPAFGLTDLDGNFSLSSGGQAPTNFGVESALINERLLVTSGNQLSILSSDGSSLQGSLDIGFFTINVDGDNDTSAFVVGALNGVPQLAEIDLTNPNSPTLAATTAFPGAGQFTGVAVNDDYIVIAANEGGLRIIDRAAP